MKQLESKFTVKSTIDAGAIGITFDQLSKGEAGVVANPDVRRAMDLVLTNRVLTAEEAEDWGLVSRVVDDDAVVEVATALARQLAQGPTKAFGLAKRVLYAGAHSPLEEAMERESAFIAIAAATEDAHEGIAAFLAKRAPVYHGR